MSLKLVVIFAAAVLALPLDAAPQKVITLEKNTAKSSPLHTEIRPPPLQVEEMSARVPMVSARPTDSASSDKDTRELLSVKSQQLQEGAKTGNDLADVLDELDTTEEELLNVLGPDFHGDLNRMTFEEIMDAVDDAGLEEEEEEEEEDMDEKLTPGEMKEFEAWEKSHEEEIEVEGPVSEVPLKPLPVIDISEENVINVRWEQLEDQPEEEVDGKRIYRSWHLLTVVLILAGVVVGGYLCVNNRKRSRKDQREAGAKIKTYGNY